MAATKKTAPKKTVKKTTTAKKVATPKAKAVAKPAAKAKASVTKAAAKKGMVSSSSKAKTSAVKKATAPKKAVKKPVKKVLATRKISPKKVMPQAVAKYKEVTFRVMRGTRINGQLLQKTQEYAVKYDASTTVLSGLEQIKADQDGTLTFRRSCRASICGSCGMFIANRSRLACKTKIMDLVEGNASKNIAPVADAVIEISPQKNLPVQKDLVVDIDEFYRKVKAIDPFIKEGAEEEKNVGKDSYAQVNLVSNCIMCGSCVSDCTAMVENPEYLGPAALAKAYRFVADPREGEKKKRLKKLSQKNGVWDCTRCGMCIDACPKDVAPMEAIVKLRSLAMQAGIKGNAGARHAQVFKADIANWGVLNEAFMLLKTKGIVGTLGQISNALNLVKKGKIPEPFPYSHKVEGLDEIKAIYKELEENPISVETKAEDSGPGAG